MINAAKVGSTRDLISQINKKKIQRQTINCKANTYRKQLQPNPLTPGAFCEKRRFLDILVVFRLDLSQISFNLVKNALASRQLGFLAPSIAFCEVVLRHFDSGMRRNQNFASFWRK